VHSPQGDGSGRDGYDEVVQFGDDRSPGGRWLPGIALACLVLAAIVTVALRITGHHSGHAANTRPPPAIRVITVGHRLLGVTAGWELFARGPDDLLRFQLAEGRISVTRVPPLGTADPNVAFVVGPREVVIRSTDLVPGYVVPDGAQARQLTGPLAGSGPLVAGPARRQSVWAWDSRGLPASPALSLVTLSDRRAGPTIRFAPGGPQLPATAVSDGRGGVLVDTGSFNVYDAGPGWDRPVPGTVVAVGPTTWLVVSCNPLYRLCRNEVVDIADGARRTLPGPAAAGYPYDFFSWPPTGVIAPDGGTAAVAETASGQPTTSEIASEGGTAGVSQNGRHGVLTVHLINLRTGANRDLGIPLGADLSDQSMVWSPDSRWLFVAAADGKLVAVDASTGRAELLPAPLPLVEQVAIRPLSPR
jgi:hypothetical protein